MKYVLITRTVGPQTTIVFCQGEMGIAAVEELHQAVDPLVEDSTLHLVLDLRDVEYVSSSVLQFLMEAQDRIKKKGGRTSLVGAEPVVRPAFQVAQLASLFEFCETLEELGISPPASKPTPVPPAGPLGKPAPAGPSTSKPTPTSSASRPGPGESRPRGAREDLPQASPGAGRRVLAFLGGTGCPDRGLAAAFALPLPGRLLSPASFCHSA